ncbi:amidohydrolase family protein [Bradyrhizobium sp. dw_411]|uniref:amidohydrolase family protein n=1 Tax=Bradyrhizobium sp. dw_411 TaxID=2720082 RepID=UPI001BCF4AE9|nr:amidohydrolase family protein [Bradyrhizobium sp. dw_411]
MITDMHCHFVPEDFFRFAQSRDEFAIKIKRREGDAVDLDIRGMHFGLNTTFFEMNKQLERMARDGVERTILSLATPFIDYHLDAKIAVEAARVFNDGLAAAIASDRKRFGGWALLPMQDPVAAAQELRRCVRDHGFVGGHVASNVRGVYLHDAQFEPIYRAAVDLNVPLFVHPADPLGKDRTKEYELTIVAGYLFDNTINILKMICSGFLDRWPALKLIYAHAGAFSLPLRARMQREVDTNPQLASSLKMPIGDYLRRLYFDTICFEPAMLRYVTEVVPVEHLMLGSDAPFPLGEPNPVTFVKNALPADQAELILNRNFDRLIGA